MGMTPESDSKGKLRVIVPIELSVRTDPLRPDRHSHVGQTIITLPNQFPRPSDLRLQLELNRETDGESNEDSKDIKPDDINNKIINNNKTSPNPNSRSGTTTESGPDKPEDRERDRDKPDRGEEENEISRNRKKEKQEIVDRIKKIKKKHQKIREDKKQKGIKEFLNEVVENNSPVGDNISSFKTNKINPRDQYNSLYEGLEERKVKVKRTEIPPKIKLKQGLINFTTIKLEGKFNKRDYREIQRTTQTGRQIVIESSVTNQPEDNKDSPEEEPEIYRRGVQTPSQQ